MDYKRLTSALLGFPLVVVMLLIGNKYITGVAISIIAMISISEYFNAVSKVSKPVKWVGYLSCLVIAMTTLVTKNEVFTMASISLNIIFLMLFLAVIFSGMKTTIKDVSYTFFGIFYVVFCSIFLVLIDQMEHGQILIWYTIFSAWGTDTFAYFTGKAIGKHKFSKVSPKKSIEGCIGGTIGAVVLMLIYTYFINKNLNLEITYTYIIGMGIILSILGQIGDFAASSIKRFVDVKDYSNLIPGHGGMLDRIDSLIFLAPFAYILLSIM